MAPNIMANGPSPYQQSTAPLPVISVQPGTYLREMQGEYSRQETKLRAGQMSWQPSAYVATLFEPGLLGVMSPEPQLRIPVSSAFPVSGNFSQRRQAAIGGTPYTSRAGAQKRWLTDALGELDQIDQETAQEGLPPSNELSKGNARHIIIELATGPYPQPAVYPTEDGEIAILFQKQSAQAGVLILCDSDGGGACFSTIAGKKRRARYDDASELPDAFVKGELLKLTLA